MGLEHARSVDIPRLNASWHLAIDDYPFARVTGFDRVTHHPRAMGVVLPADQPWETFGAAANYVGRREDGTFFAFYQAMWWDPGLAAQTEDVAHHMRSAVAYATSPDGIHWEKPDLGLRDAPAAADLSTGPTPTPLGTTRENNLGAPFSYVFDLGRHGNVTDPGRQFALRLVTDENVGVMATWEHSPQGYFAKELPDFLGDPDWREKLVSADSEFNPRRRMLHYYDDIHDEWVAIDQGVTPSWMPSREVARFASKDLINWHSEAALYPDADDPHLPHQYDEPMMLMPFCAEGVVMGLLSWFHSDRTTGESGGILTPTPDHPHVWPWYRKGTNELRITLSRDGGKTWDRTSSREAWIPHGTEEDAYDRVVIGSLPPLRVGDEDWFYVNVMDGDHLVIRNNPLQNPYYHNRVVKHNTALYVQKHNRYVSLRAGTQPEVLISKPMIVDGDTLRLNVDASHGR
ncbi:MAG TPA: hypothetical protein QGH10_09550, partial [Armatimonadota bacterium]|nr:hypothetical protein [Armatimonadota bacterium]